MAWEIENTVTTDNNANQPQWEIEESKPLTQSVMDAETQQMYNVPLGMDATDAKFAIDTQHGGKDKGSFLGKVWTGIDIAGSSIEEVFQDFNRALVEHTGQIIDSVVLDKMTGYQGRMAKVEDWENGDWSYFGDKELSDEEKQGIIRRQKEKIAYIQNLRERTQKFFNKGAQIMRPDEKLDNADKFFIAASSGIVSTAEAAAVAIATKNPTVAAAAIGTTYAALKDTEYFDKAIAAGESANDASADATVAGAIEGGLEFVGDRLLLGIGKVKPIQQLGNKVISSSIAKTIQSKVGRSAIGKIASRHPQSIFGAVVKGAVTEGGEEFMQEGAGMLWENYNDVSSYSMDEILSQSLFAFAAGSVSGAGMGVVGTSIYNQKITKDNTAIKNILKENTPELTDEELQVVADNVQEALLQQGAAYDEQITNLLRKESEIDVMPDGLTAESLTADTRAMLKEKYGMSDEDINKTIDIAANYIDARNGFNETYNEYFDKMDVAGYDRTVADNVARVLAARAVAIARAEGVSTEEVRKRWNLNLTRQSYEDFKNGAPVTDNYTPRQRQIDDIMSVVPENWTPEQKKALRKGIAARARYGDLDKANFNAETAKQWFETKGAEESVKAINKRVQTIMGVLNFKEEVENVKKSKRINPQNVNPFEALVDDKLYNKIARIEKENKGDSLISFIVKRGGLKDVGGELKNMDAQKQRIGLINNKSGNSFDDMALAAWEHGYFSSKSERPTIQDLLDAIDAELFGKKRYQYQEGNTESVIDYVNSLAEQMDMLGIDYRGMTAEEAEAAYYKAAEEYSKNAKQYEPETTGETFDDDFTLFQPKSSNVSENAIDLTDLVDNAGNLSEEDIFNALESVLNKAMDTLSKPLQIQVVSGNKGHIAGTNINLTKPQKKRHYAAIQALEKIVNNAVKNDKDGTVKLDHNRGKTKEHKENDVIKYVYFDSPVKIKGIDFNVELHTEQTKGQDPNLLNLYHIRVRRNPAANSIALQGSYKDNVTQNKESVNRNLVVYHTISADNLAKAIDFGGFPAPSLAIVKKDEPFNFGGNEGNIQLIGNKDLINPENSTEVYNRDVWTKTFPFATYETPTFEATRKFEKEYEQYFDRVNDRGALSSLAYVAQSNPAAARDSFINSTGTKLAYLEKNKGKEVELPERDLSDDYLKQGDIDVQFVEEVKDFDEYSDREEFLRKISAAAKRLLDRKYDNSTSRFAQKLKQKMLADLFNADGVLYFGVADRYMNSAKRYLQTKGAVAVDYYAARDFINEQIKDETAYKQWATKQIEDNLLGEPKVEVGDELLPFTLENVTKAMIDGATQNAQDSLVYGSGKAIAAGAKALNSIEEIKLESKKLVTQELSAEKTKQLNDDMEVFTKQFVKYDNENYFFARDAAYKALGTIAAKENPTIDDLQEALDYEFGEKYQYSQTLLKSGVRIAKSIRNLSRYYFEAKPQRAVALNEFSGAIIPTADSFNEIADKVAAAGLRVVRSDNQLEAIKQFEDVYFQETLGDNVPPRGAFVERGDQNIIYAFENADASTVIHELGHFFLHDMQKFSDNAKTAEQLAAIYKYLGSEDGNLTREQEEKFADTYEVYLLDGRAPNQILRGVFARFKKWISSLWYEVKRLKGINITDEVRATFDEMMGGKGLDFAMQASTLKMGQMLERGNISQWQTNRAMQLLYEGKMSKADMQELIRKLRGGMKNKEFVEALKEFENKPAKSNKELLTEWDYTVFRNQLDGLNFNRDNVKARIEKLLKWSEPRTSGGKLVGRFPNKQLNDAFARYRELATMNKDDAKQKLQENVELIEEQMKSGGDVDIEQLIFENRLLSYNLNKISNSELLKLYDGLAESYNMGRLTDKITGDAKRERKKQMIERAKAVLTGNGSINPNIESSEIKKRLARFGLSQQSWGGLLDTLSMNDMRSTTGKSAISQDLDMFEAEQKKYAGIATDSDIISQKLEKALSGTMNKAQSVTHYLNTELDKKVVIEWSGLVDPKERNPKYQKWQPFKRTFTKDQLIDIYMKSLDNDTRDIMINDPVNQYNAAFLNKVKDELTTDDLAVADAIFEFYNENYERFNAFYEEHFGMSLPKSKYYTPRSMSIDGVTIDDKTTHGYASFSGAKKRVAVAGTGVINIQGAFRALNKYINQQNHYMGYMDKLTDINAVLANKDIKNVIQSLFGAEMNKRIQYEIDNLANNGNDKVDAMGKFWNKSRANYAKSVLSVKPSLAIKQLTSFPAYWENVGTKDFIAGVADFFAHPKEAIRTLGGTTLMKTRGTDIIRDFDQISKSDLFTKMKKAKGKIKWNDLLMFNIKFGDRGAIYMGGWALYKSELNKNLKAGMTEKTAKAKALEAFERITDETQQSGRLSQQSYMQSNSFWRAFTMFTSSQNQYLRKEINAIRGLATGRMSKAKAAKTIFIYHVLLPVFFQVVSDGFRWDKDNDLRAAVLGSLNGWFILNKVLENVYNWITDNGNMFKTRMSVRDLVPFWGSIEDLKNDVLKFADDEMELEDVLDVIKPIGEVTGLPLKYAKDVVENAGEYAADDEYFKEGLLWLGWSPYSLRDSDDE